MLDILKQIHVCEVEDSLQVLVGRDAGFLFEGLDSICQCHSLGSGDKLIDAAGKICFVYPTTALLRVGTGAVLAVEEVSEALSNLFSGSLVVACVPMAIDFLDKVAELDNVANNQRSFELGRDLGVFLEVIVDNL